MEILDIGTDFGDHVAVGKVIKAHGIKGEVKVFPYSGYPDDFKSYDEIMLCAAVPLGANRRDEPCVGEEYAVDRSRSQEKVAILQLRGVTNRDGAEALRGMELLIRKDKLPPLEVDCYYWHDLKGLTVKTDDGREIGRVTDLLVTAAHYILVVKGGGREYMIPAKNEFVARIDQEEGVLHITPPPGLLEINE